MKKGITGTGNYGINLNNKGLSRGQGRKFLSFSGRNTIVPKERGYNYKSGIVVEVISDPKSFFSNRQTISNFYESIEEEQKNSSATYHSEENLIHKIPKNSIVCKLIDNGKDLYAKKNIVCFPFFSPHVALPIKPGEHVWILEELFDDFPRYYWMSRKHSAYYNDNINVSSHEREIEIYSNSSLSRGIDAFTKEEINEMHSFPNAKSNNNFAVSKSQKKELTNEPVPEVVKKCGDLTFQGSNNTLIHLTTEKFMTPGDINRRYDKTLFAAGSINDDSIRTPMSPAIDICVLRKKKHLVELSKKLQENTEPLRHQIGEKNILALIKNSRDGETSIENYEINKFDEDYYSNKDKDPTNCGSRLYMSNNCDIDSVFNVADYEENVENLFNQYGGATLVGYSEHIRMIAEGEESTFRVVKKLPEGSSTFLEIDNDGTVKIGSKKGNVESEGGVPGLQPFVKGDELQNSLNRILAIIDSIAKTIKDNTIPGLTNITPGYSGPNPGLTKLGKAMPSIISEIESIKEDLPRFKSSLIKGE